MDGGIRAEQGANSPSRPGEQNGWQNLAWEAYVDTLTDEEILEGDYDPSQLSRTEADFGLDKSDYKLLTKQTVWTGLTPEQRRAYGDNTDKRPANIDETASLMVGMTQKIIYEIANSDQENYPYPDQLIYLDKSGRPVSWFVNTFWDDFAPKDASGAPCPRPPHAYVNIDRGRLLETFFNLGSSDGGVGRTGDQIKDEFGNYKYFGEAWDSYKQSGRITTEHFAKLRALFLDNGLPEGDLSPEEIMQLPCRLDGKNLMIIDEVASSAGTTLNMARTLFEGAFPGAKVRTATFWFENADQSVPVWYDSSNVEGRGIGDVDPPYYEDKLRNFSDPEWVQQKFDIPSEKAAELQAASLPRLRAKHYGRILLSAPTNLELERGGLTRALTDDIRQLHADYQAHKVFPRYVTFSDEAQDRSLVEVVRQGVNPRQIFTIRDKLFARNNNLYTYYQNLGRRR